MNTCPGKSLRPKKTWQAPAELPTGHTAVVHLNSQEVLRTNLTDGKHFLKCAPDWHSILSQTKQMAKVLFPICCLVDSFINSVEYLCHIPDTLELYLLWENTPQYFPYRYKELIHSPPQWMKNPYMCSVHVLTHPREPGRKEKSIRQSTQKANMKGWSRPGNSGQRVREGSQCC